MNPTGSSVRVVQFGAFELDLRAGELRKHGFRVKLSEQPSQILAMLLERPGEVVTREELCQKLWSTDTFVDFEHSLNAAIKKLRQALGDSADNPRFIETLPRKGYRFIAPVKGQVTLAPARRPVVLWATAALSVIVAAGGAGWILSNRIHTPEAQLVPVPLTSYPGSEQAPSFSPDGNQVAFVWNGPHQDHADIYIKLIGTDPPVRVTTNGAVEPAWSPDGRLIAFHRFLSKDKCGVFVIPAIGGSERKVAEIASTEWQGSHYVAWHPGGRWLVVPDKSSSSEPFGLFLVSVDTGEKRRLTSPPQGLYGDQDPDVSPDGSAVAFVRAPDLAISDVFLLELSEGLSPKGQPLRLTHDNGHTTSPVWMPDGHGLLFSSGAAIHQAGLWRVALSRPGWRPGKAQPLTFAGDEVRSYAVSRQGRLAYTQSAGAEANIWRLELSTGKAGAGSGKPPVRLIASTRLDHTPQYSPDGKHIAFASNRSGSHEIWVCNSDGSNATQLTSFGGPYASEPKWSQDGRRIAFSYKSSGKPQTYVVDSDGGKPQPMTLEGFSGWSRDGKWIYFVSNRTGQDQLWKMPAGGGDAVQVTNKGGGEARESPDGKSLYYLKEGKESSSLWKVPVEGGEETKVVEPVCPQFFTVAVKGIYFISNCEEGEVRVYSFATRKAVTVFRIGQHLAWGLSVSPDGRWLLYSRYEQAASDLMLVENFR